MAERNDNDQQNPSHVINARIFGEMRQADSMRATQGKQKQMKESMAKKVLEKCRQSGVGQALGRLYESPMARSIGKIAGEVGLETERSLYGRYPIHEATPESPQAGIHGEQSISKELQADIYGRNAEEPEPEIEQPEIDDQDLGR